MLSESSDPAAAIDPIAITLAAPYRSMRRPTSGAMTAPASNASENAAKAHDTGHCNDRAMFPARIAKQ